MAADDPPRATAAPNAKASGSNLPKLIIAVVVGGAAVAAIWLLPVRPWMESFLDWVDALGFWAPLAVAAFYIVACVFSLPGSVLTIGAGAALGVFRGVIAVSIGSTLGAAAAFLIGRFIARDWVAGKISGRPKFSAIDEAVGREGFKIVLLTRLSPIFPFNLLNYAYGLTRVPFGAYLLASWIGMIPGTIMYVYLGSVGKVATRWADMTAAQRILYAGGLIAAVVVAVMATRIARRALREAVAPNAEPTDRGADA